LLLLTEVRSDGLTRWQSVEMRRCCCCCCCWQKSGQMDLQAADEPASAAVDGQFTLPTYVLSQWHLEYTLHEAVSHMFSMVVLRGGLLPPPCPPC